MSFAKTPQQLNAIPVTRYMTSWYVTDFQCALNFGEAQGKRGFHLAAFFDGHGRYAAQSGIFTRQFLVAESAVNLL